MENSLSQVIRRALNDVVFRAQLKGDAAAVLAGMGLAPAELAAISSGDPERLTALGVDRRMSRAFAQEIVGHRWTAIDPDMSQLGPTGKTFTDEAGYDGRAANSAVIGAVEPPDGGMAAFNLRRIEGDLDVTQGSDVDVPQLDAGEHCLTEY